jgi:hypothetical protein
MRNWLAVWASLFAGGIVLGQGGEPIHPPREIAPPAPGPVQSYSLPSHPQAPAYREVMVPAHPIYQYNYPADVGGCCGHGCSKSGLLGLRGLFNRGCGCCECERPTRGERRACREDSCERPLRGQRLLGRKSACCGGDCGDSCCERGGFLPRLRSWLFFRTERTRDCGGCCGGAPNAPLYQYFMTQPCVEGCGGYDGGCRTGHRHFSSPTGHGCSSEH